MAADSVRTLWTYEVIVYGHFPGWPSPRETLCHQIEHHLFWVASSRVVYESDLDQRYRRVVAE